MPTPYSASIRPRPRKDGTVAHDVRFRQDGQSKTLSFNDPVGASKWANILRQVGPEEALALLNSGTGDSPTVQQYADTYIATKSGVEPKTLEHYRMYVRAHMPFKDYPIDAVGPATIANWINAQAKAGSASKSIKNRHGFLSAMFAAAMEDGLITKNPCSKSRIPETVTKQEMVFLTADEFTTLLDYIPDNYQALVLTLGATGIRWGEATALKPSDVDMDAQTIRVSKAWKSSQAEGWYLGPPKTKRSKRTISFPDNLKQHLEPLMGQTFLFQNRDGQPVRQAKFYEAVWAPARNLANGLPARNKSEAAHGIYIPRKGGVWDRTPASKPLGKWPRVHDLRHSHASWLIAAGVPLITIQRRLGHESIQTTSEIYSHLSPDMLQAPADVIGSVLAGAMPQLES